MTISFTKVPLEDEHGAPLLHDDGRRFRYRVSYYAWNSLEKLPQLQTLSIDTFHRLRHDEELTNEIRGSSLREDAAFDNITTLEWTGNKLPSY
jgi:hypothetical protein